MGTVDLKVRGSATLEAPPDLAVVSVGTRAVSVDRAAAMTSASAAADVVRAAVTGAAGVQQMTFSRVNVTVNRQLRDGTYVDNGFSASMSGSVRVDADEASALVERLVAAGADVHGVSWILDDDNPVFRHVRAAAVADAERAAADFADALGHPLGELVALADPGLSSGSSPRGGMIGAAAAGAWSEPEVNLDPQPVRLSAAVEAHYLTA